MTNEEIETLGRDIAAGQVVGSWSAPSDLLNMIFLPFGLLDAEGIQTIKDKDVAHIYEYLDKAGPRSVNGWPCFMSFKWVNKTDWEKVAAVVKEHTDFARNREAAAKARDEEKPA